MYLCALLNCLLVIPAAVSCLYDPYRYYVLLVLLLSYRALFAWTRSNSNVFFVVFDADLSIARGKTSGASDDVNV